MPTAPDDASVAGASAAEEERSRSWSRLAKGSGSHLRCAGPARRFCCSRLEALARFFVGDSSFSWRGDCVASAGGALVRFRAGGLNWRSAWGTSAGFVRVSATDAASAADRRTRWSLISLSRRGADETEHVGVLASAKLCHRYYLEPLVRMRLRAAVQCARGVCWRYAGGSRQTSRLRRSGARVGVGRVQGLR